MIDGMENILSYLSKCYIQNPDLKITWDTVYNLLANYDITREERANGSIRFVFDTLKSKFGNGNTNLRVFETHLQPGFIQIRNTDEKVNERENIKIYLSFPKESMNTCVNMICDFLNANNIRSYSKLSQEMRADSLVLRIPSEEEAKIVLNYINNNQYLVSQAKHVSPFAINYGICGVSYDDALSYNETISKLIAEYFKNLRRLGLLETASVEGLSDYISFVDESFKDPENLKIFIKSGLLDKDYKRIGDMGRCINGVEKILMYFSMFLNGELDINEFFNLYAMFKDKYTNEADIEKYNEILGYSNKTNQPISQSMQQDILNDYIKIGISKYGIYETTERLKAFMGSNDYMVITSENNLRDKFKNNNITGQVIYLITNGNLEQYINSKTNKQEIEKITPEQFEDMCNSIYKSNKSQHELGLMLIQFYNGNFNAIKNSENYEIIKNSLKDNSYLMDLCKSYLESKGISFLNMEDSFILYQVANTVEKQFKNNKKESNAVPSVQDLYNVLFEYVDLGIKKYGISETTERLKVFINSNDYRLITNTNNIRDKFINYKITGNTINTLTKGNIENYVKTIYENNNSQVPERKMNLHEFEELCVSKLLSSNKEELLFSIRQAYYNNSYIYLEQRTYIDNELIENTLKDKQYFLSLCVQYLNSKGIGIENMNALDIINTVVDEVKYQISNQQPITQGRNR